MAKISFLRKLKLYFEYRSIIKQNFGLLSKPENGLRKDMLYRLYTVLNMGPDTRIYGTQLTETYVKQYVSNMDSIFREIGLSEYIGIYNIEKLDEANFLVIFSYTQFDPSKIFRKMIIWTLTIVTLITTYLLFF